MTKVTEIATKPNVESDREKALKAELMRLNYLRGFEESKRELLRVLDQNADSEDHAKRIITRIIDTRRPNEGGFVACPTPAELVDLCGDVPATASVKAPYKQCATCDGTGWKLIQRNGKSGVDRCPCTRVTA